VAGTQLPVWLWARDLELELSRGGGVGAQRAENVRATLQRDPARFGGREFDGRTVRESGRQLSAFQRARAHAERFRQPRAGFGPLGVRVAQIKPGLVERGA